MVALAASAAVVVMMATPASAALPFNQRVTGTVVDGNIHVGNRDFGLGASANPAPQCNPGGVQTTISADVGPLVGTTATLSNFDFNFAPGQFTVGGSTVCVQLTVDNEPSVTGSITVPSPSSNTGTMTVSGARVDVAVNGGPCGIQNINVTPASGPINGTASPIVANLDTNPTFSVPGFSGCASNFLFNLFFGVPANNGDLQLTINI